MKRIYLDYNATTPVHPAVAIEMEKYIKEHFGNPSSSHWFGKKAKAGVESAREQVARLLGCKTTEIIFTSGGTESNNYVIRGVAETFKHKGNHIITSQIEHPSVIMPCQYLEKQGCEVTYLPVDKYGRIGIEDLKKAIRPTTILISIMHANNEVGTIQSISEITKIARERGVLTHTDAAQSAGKISTKVLEMGVDFLTIAGHKIYAPKGVGALYIRKGIEIEPLILGAGHEHGRRAGTENVIEIVGLGKACELLEKTMQENGAKLKKLRNKFYDGLIESGIRVKLNGHPIHRLPNTLNVSFLGMDSHELLEKTPGIAASTGSACHADLRKPSRVLSAMGIRPSDALGAVRFSLGLRTTEKDIEIAINELRTTIMSDHGIR